MPLVLDVLTHIDERAAAASARQLERQFEESGHEAGEKFGSNLATGVMAGFHDADFDSMLGVLSSGGMAAQALSHGSAVGAAFAGGIVAAASVALVDLGVKVGETFENINRDITLHTAASGQALEELKGHADALVGSLDSSSASLGNDMATLSTRLRMEAGPALDELTKHVEMLRDRFGNFNVGALAGAFQNLGVDGKNADDTLASVVNTVQRFSLSMPDTVNNLAAFSSTFGALHLTAGQAAAVLGEVEGKGIPASRAMTGLESAMSAANKKGEDFNTFIRRVSDSLEYYGRTGNETAAEQISLDVFGSKKWAESEKAALAYFDVVQKGPDAFAGNGQQLTQLQKDTQTLGNRWTEVENKVKGALAPVGISVVDDISSKMDGFIRWLDAHSNDLRQFFETSIGAIGQVVETVGQLAALLGRHPALIEAIGYAFATWESIKGVNAVLTGLESLATWLGILPADAEAAAAGVAAADAEMATATTAAGAEMAASMTPVMTELGAIPAEAEAAGAAIATAAEAGDAAMMGLAATLGTVVADLLMVGTTAAMVLTTAGDQRGATMSSTPDAPGQDVTAKHQATKAYADAHGGKVPDRTQQWVEGKGPMPQEMAPYYHPAGGGPAGGAPAGPPPAPGSALAQPGGDATRAGPTLPGNPDGSDPNAAGGGPPSDLLTPGDFGPKGPKGPRLPEAPQVPYGPGFGAPPRPGEGAEQYNAEQRVLEEQHNVATARARLNQLEQDNNATADDIQKARNALLDAQRQQYSAELELTKKHTTEMGDIGVKIDNDFGISKGLSGIAENITRFVGNLAMAGPLAAMQKIIDEHPTGGGAGLIGIGAANAGISSGPAGAGGSPLLSALGLGGGRGAGGVPSIAGLAAGVGTAALGGVPGESDLGAGGLGVPGAPGAAAPAGNASGAGMPAGAGLDAWIEAAEKVAGVDASWTPGLKTLIGRESGGNPSAINLSDSNALAGHPSQGLMQTIPGTFSAYHVPGTSDAITDPIANIAAGIRYIQGRYGGISAVQQANPNLPPKGYATGGEVLGPQSLDSGGVVHDPREWLKSLQHAGSDIGGWIGTGSDWLQQHTSGPKSSGQSITDALKTAPQGAVARSALGALFEGAPGLDGGGAVPIIAHTGEHMLTVDDVRAMGGHDQVYAFRQVLQSMPHFDDGGAVLPGQSQGATMIGGQAPDKGIGSGMPGGSGGGGGMAAGAAAGAASMGIGMAVQIGMQEAQRGIQYLGQLGGIGVEGLEQTLLPTGASQLAQNSWLTRIGGAVAGARPQIPNMAGKSQNTSPEGKSGMPGGGLPILGPDVAPTPASVQSRAGGGETPSRGGPGSANQAGYTQHGPVVHIENYHSKSDNPYADGAEMARHTTASYQSRATPGAR